VALALFLVVAVGCGIAFADWLRDFNTPQIVLLGSGNHLSLFVIDGPARLLLASGDDPIAYENALSRVRPLFARRVDVLLIAGNGRSLLVPVSAHGDHHVRTAIALAPLAPSPESATLDGISTFTGPKRIHLGPTVSVTVETALPLDAGSSETSPAWRATIERGETRVVVYSDGESAARFSPQPPASVLVVSGQDPATAWGSTPAVAFIANAQAVSGPELRTALGGSGRPPQWRVRVAPGEALRLHFVPGGIELPVERAQQPPGTPVAMRVADRTPAARS
jgi:hypothetical protein